MTETDAAVSTFALPLTCTIRAARYDDLRRLEWFGEYTRYRKLFERSYDDQRHGTRLLLVADVNDFPVGRLFVLFEGAPELADGHERAYLYSFRVMDLFQGAGIGTRLVQAAEAVLVARGFHIVTIAVAKTNDGALRLYQRMDYHITRDDPGRWTYTDHLNQTQTVDEPCYILEKRLKVR